VTALPHGLYLQEARMSDVDEVTALEDRAFPVPWKRAYFASEVGEPFRFNKVIRGPGGELAGYLFCAFAAGEIHVHKIAVSEGWRRKGVAFLLMDDLFEFAVRTGGEEIYLEVRPSNGPAREFYRTMGFREVGRRPRYYLDGEDALVLAVPIPPPVRLDWLREKRGDSGGAEKSNNQEVSMPTLTEELKRELTSSNEEFQKLLRHHHEHERRLAELASKSFLSSDEEIEEKKLKKEKLHLKDRMEEIAREYKARVGSPH
jgi:[ribosomal protein S18]-alanine N-acetyltransferase